MEYIDLHMHSLFSDGTDSPDELVRRAKEAGLSMIALTDHNTLDGIMDFRKACRRHGMTGIGGIELSTGWEDAVLPAAADGSQTAGSKPDFPDKEPPEIHILGYFPEDADLSAASFAPLRKVVEDYHLLKLRHNEAIVQRIADAAPGADLVSVAGFHVFARTQSDSGNYNRVHIARYLVQTGTASSVDDAFGRFITSPCRRPSPPSTPPAAPPSSPTSGNTTSTEKGSAPFLTTAWPGASTDTNCFIPTIHRRPRGRSSPLRRDSTARPVKACSSRQAPTTTAETRRTARASPGIPITHGINQQ